MGGGYAESRESSQSSQNPTSATVSAEDQGTSANGTSSAQFSGHDDSPAAMAAGGEPGGDVVGENGEVESVCRILAATAVTDSDAVGVAEAVAVGETGAKGGETEANGGPLMLGAEERFSARVLHRFKGTDATHVSVRRGEEVTVHQLTSTSWWYVETPRGEYGFVPVSYLEKPAELQASDENEDTSTQWEDSQYFESYAHAEIHNEMLSDFPRTDAYRRAIEGTALEGKVVMDVGCGSGVLSMFAARAGAAHVYAVEASDLAAVTREVVAANGLADRITVINGKVEELAEDALPGKVDLIISEWMGTLLVFEGMLESVLVARDRWLADDGAMFPSDAALFFAPVRAEQYFAEKIDFWREQFGFDFSPLRALAVDEFLQKPRWNHVFTPEDVMAEPALLYRPCMRTMRAQDWEAFATPDEQPMRFVFRQAGLCHGLGSWFDVTFDGGLPRRAASEPPVTLSCAPGQPLTHWKHDLLAFDAPVAVEAGTEMTVRVKVVRNPVYRRHLRVQVHYAIAGVTTDGEEQFKEFKVWR